VFKDGNLPWRRTRPRLLAMLDGELLKENVDGEALLWAFERLRRRTEPRRLLVVISDGAPRDDSTVALNDPGYLERHLRQAIEAIESGSSVELLAIGIGHNVGDYYRRSLTVTGPENLGETLVRQLIPLLRARRRRRSARERAR
jgi:cobaltochelatase CobT